MGLVFCDSRGRVEELGNELRDLGVTVFLSHSSLSAEERKTSEQAFAEAQDCVIVSTSTLELGIDVGDLDRVIQIDAPHSVASFLQRLGRTGRRSGTTRNCLFLATSENALLKAAALLELWTSGFVEPIRPPARPLHLFAQQLMALSLQEGGIGGNDWFSWLGRLPAFANESREVLDEVVRFLLHDEILFSDGARLSFGDAGQALYGRRHFLELVSVFTSDPVFKVLHGRKELGTVDQITFLRHSDDEPTTLSMGGRSWVVTALDWNRREAFVVPTPGRGKSQWLGGGMGMSYRLSRAVHSVLTDAEVSPRWSNRARQTMESLRAEYAFLHSEEDVVFNNPQNNETRWFTFAGGVINTALADAVRACGVNEVSSSDFIVKITEATGVRSLVDRVRHMTGDQIVSCFIVSEEFTKKLKFSECLPKLMVQELLRGRMLNHEDIQATLVRNVALVEDGN